MNFPSDIKYTKDHEWIKAEGNTATIGITDFAQHELGDIVYVDVPSVGKPLKAQEMPDWREGKRQRVDLDSGRNLLFYLKDGAVSAVYEDLPDSGRTKIWPGPDSHTPGSPGPTP